MADYLYISDLAHIEVMIVKALGSGRLEGYEVTHLANVVGAFLEDTVNGEYDKWEDSEDNREKWDSVHSEAYDRGYLDGRAEMKYEMENPDERR